MNLPGNLGAAFSAISFPVFRDHVTLPFFAATPGAANSFFVFAAGLNTLAILAWLFMNPRRKTGTMTPMQVRIRLALFVTAAVLLVGGAQICTRRHLMVLAGREPF